MSTPKNPEDDDPVLKAELERALKPYQGLVPRRYLEDVLKPILRHALTENPVGKKLLDRVRAIKQRPPSKSGEKTMEGVRPLSPSNGKMPGGKP
jgi:hypothetical protein